MKKITAFVLAFMIVFGIGAIGISAVTESEFYTEDIYQYTVSDGEAKIKDVFGLVGDATLPRELGGYPVTAIGEGAVRSENQLINIVIPSCIENIEKSAFMGCDFLETVTFEDNSKVKSIGETAFQRCIALKTVDFGKNSALEEICASAFVNCSSLENIVLPDSLETVGDKAFENCTSLKSIVIPVNVGYIGEGPFASCHSLEKIYADENNPYFTADEWGILYNKDKTILVTYPAGSRRLSFVIPDYISYVSKSAFMGNEYLEEISWVNPETEIGISAFSFCTSLYRANIPEGTEIIDDWIFNACYSLTEVNLPESVEVLDAGAFHWCTSLETIDLPPNLYWIAPNCFKECTSLNNIVLPEGLLEIGGSAFEKCFSLESISIPESVKLVKHSAFYQCFSLKEIILPESLPGKYSPAFLPGVFTNEFRYCFNVENITLPSDAEIIQDGAFEDCRKLESVTVPQKVHTMTGSAFKNNMAFESISVDEENKSFSASSDGILFNKNKTKLVYYPANKPATVYTVPATVREIGEYAFSNIQNLASIIIPASVERIESYAFHSFNLRDIYFEGTEEEWNAFEASTNTAVKNATVHFNYKNGDHVHDYSQEITVEPTCKANGRKIYTCSCGESTEKEFHYSMAGRFCKDAEFEWVNPVDSDCTKMGSVEYSCKKCGNCMWESAVAKKRHDTEFSVSDNSIDYNCNDCSYAYTETVPSDSGYVWFKADNLDELYIVRCGERIHAPDVPEREGLDFAGWKDESGNIVDLVMPSGNIVLTPAYNKTIVQNEWDISATFNEDCFEGVTDISKVNLVVQNLGVGNNEVSGGEFIIKDQNGGLFERVGFYDVKMTYEEKPVTFNEGKTVKLSFPIAGNEKIKKFMVIHRYTNGGAEYFYIDNPSDNCKDGMVTIEISRFSEFEIYIPADTDSLKKEYRLVSAPSKTNYIYKKDRFIDLSGIAIEVTDYDGSKEIVTDTSVMWAYDYDSSKTGTQTIRVEYDGVYFEYEIIVNYTWWQWMIRIFLLGFIWY